MHSRYLFFFLLAGWSCHPVARIEKVESNVYALAPGENAMVDSTMLKKIQPYKDSLDADMNVVLAESAASMEKGLPESVLGNFFSDICLSEANKMYHPSDNHPVDFAFFNNGGLRSSLPKGAIRKRDVYELMPFENELIVLTLHGASVQKIFNFIASKGGVPVAGLRMNIQNNKPANPMIHGMAFDSTRAYKVLTSDYLANGGDQCFFLEEATNREYTGQKIRDVLLTYLQAQGRAGTTVSSRLDQRITVNHVK